MGKDVFRNAHPVDGAGSSTGQQGISQKINGPMEDYFGKLPGGMDGFVGVGTVVSGLAGAIGAWWLSGKSLLLGALGGLLAAVGLPRLIAALNQDVAPTVRGAIDQATASPARTQNLAETIGAAEGADVEESRLGDLSAVMPRGKDTPDKRRS